MLKQDHLNSVTAMQFEHRTQLEHARKQHEEEMEAVRARAMSAEAGHNTRLPVTNGATEDEPSLPTLK